MPAIPLTFREGQRVFIRQFDEWKAAVVAHVFADERKGVWAKLDGAGPNPCNEVHYAAYSDLRTEEAHATVKLSE